ncbi:GntT/GntP/DsdX family permease, partial [Shewanella sp. 0m-11]
MNAVVIAVCLMLGLSLARVNIVIALTISALVAGLVGGMDLHQTVAAFNTGLGGGAQIALSYALLGAFAVALSHSGLTTLISNKVISLLGKEQNSTNNNRVRWVLLLTILSMAIASQNILPIHIAFIPILIPPLLHVMSKLKMDRRLVACVLTFGLVTTYMVLPVGFGGIFLYDILLTNLNSNNLLAVREQVAPAMIIPALGMVFGLLVAVFISYRKPREYQEEQILAAEPEEGLNKRNIVIAV